MISKAKLKLITALRSKKQRQKYHIFSAEGTKIIHEIIQQAPLSIHSIYALPTWLSENHTKLHFLNPEQIIEITEPELQSISSLVTPNQVLALIKYNPTQLNPTTTPIQPNIHLVLDNIQDPGNLGTIWRIADWFAIPNIFCSPNCGA
jgi:TrmH family RNA methyltransferase